jgi:hypothetical protein
MSELPTPRVLLPSFLAGPAVVLFLLTWFWADSIPQPVLVGPSELVVLPFLLFLASAVGLLPALAANLLGTFLMLYIGSALPLTRFPLVWALVGGAGTWVVVRYAGFTPEWAFAFTATGACSALVCRMRLA